MSICINTALLSFIHWHGGWQHLVRQQQRGDRVHQDGEYQEQEVEHSLQQDTQLPRSGREVARSLLTRQIRSITKLELRSRWRALLRRTWMLARLPAHNTSVRGQHPPPCLARAWLLLYKCFCSCLPKHDGLIV